MWKNSEEKKKGKEEARDKRKSCKGRESLEWKKREKFIFANGCANFQCFPSKDDESISLREVKKFPVAYIRAERGDDE